MTTHTLQTQNMSFASLIAADREKARDYAEQGHAAHTKRAYDADLRNFSKWTRERDLSCVPASPEAVSLYVASLADHAKPATISRRLAAISVAHKAAGYESPCSHPVVRAVLRGLRRSKGADVTQKTALWVDALRGWWRSVRALRRSRCVTRRC